MYAILDFQTCLERNLDPRVLAKSWCDAGISLIQIRAKNLSDLNYWVFAETIREVTLTYKITRIINARIDIAVGLDFDGVHLPSKGIPIKTIRSKMPDKLIFKSCHNLKDIETFDAQPPDAITLSPVFSPLSKPHDLRMTMGMTRFNSLADAFCGKTYALGGIDETNLNELNKVSVASLGFLCHQKAYEKAKILCSRDNS